MDQAEKTAVSDANRTVARELSNTELRPGDVLRERFVIERLLGEGGMGQVFLAVDREAEQSNPHVALKMLGESFKDHPQSLKALRREATQSRQLNHPNIVNVYDFDRSGDHVFMVMEYMRGHSLDVVIDGHPNGQKLSVIWPIVEACCNGLEYIHQQRLIHADFKPGNVFETDEGEIKVLDLGIARTLDETVADTGTTIFDPDALGALTPRYASCEMLEGISPTAQDDLFALACVTFELLTGSHPYPGKTAIEARASKLAPKRPKGLKNRQWRALNSALAFTRADRPASVAAFLAEIAPEKAKRSSIPWIAATALVTLVAGAVIFTQFRSEDDQFVKSLLEQYATTDEQLVSANTVADWLDQGSFFLNMGRVSMSAPDAEFGKAAAQLSFSPSSSYNSYREVLTRSDDMDAKRSAAEGMLGILQVYRETALQLRQQNGKITDIATLACQGLTINPLDSALQDLIRQLGNELTKGVRSVQACFELVNDGRIVI
jgi:serine/threonine protein kinase